MFVTNDWNNENIISEYHNTTKHKHPTVQANSVGMYKQKACYGLLSTCKITPGIFESQQQHDGNKRPSKSLILYTLHMVFAW